MQAYLPIIISAIIIFTALMWWLLGLGRLKSDVKPPEALTKADPQPTIAPSAPKAVADLAKTMPAATEPVKLKAFSGAATAKPKAKPAPKAKAAAKPAAKAKAAPAKTVAAPKVKAAPAAQPKAAPKPAAKVAAVPAPKPAPKPKVAAPKAAPKPKAAVAAKPKPAPKPVAKTSIPDDLELLKGVGPKLNTLLKSMGITSFDQVANWSPADIREIDSKLGTFAGRIGRDNWVDQAKLLVAGDVAGFEKKYGSLGSEVK